MATTLASEFICLYLLSTFIASSCESEEFQKLEAPVIYPSPPNIPVPPLANTIPPPTPLITITPNPTTVPVANPSATPVPVTNTNPTNSIPPPSTNTVTQPVMPPPAITNPPTNPGRGWCVAKSGAPQSALQAALDYACGPGGVDCSVLQQGGSCYNPVTLENHASYAFNSYYQRNPVPTSCEFGGTAMIINTDPSSGSCIFQTSSPTTTSAVPPPVIQTPNPPTVLTPPAFSVPPAAPAPPSASTPPAAPSPPTLPTTPASPTPPAYLRPPASPTPPVSSPVTAVPRASGSPVATNSTNNTTTGFPMGGFPNIFPIVNTSMPPDSPPSVTSMSKPSTLPKPFIGGIILVTFIVTWTHILDL